MIMTKELSDYVNMLKERQNTTGVLRPSLNFNVSELPVGYPVKLYKNNGDFIIGLISHVDDTSLIIFKVNSLGIPEALEFSSTDFIDGMYNCPVVLSV